MTEDGEPAVCSEGGDEGCPLPAKAGYDLCGKHMLAARKREAAGFKKLKHSAGGLERRWTLDERLNERVRAVLAERLAAV